MEIGELGWAHGNIKILYLRRLKRKICMKMDKISVKIFFFLMERQALNPYRYNVICYLSNVCVTYLKFYMNTLTFNVRYHRLYLIFKIFVQKECTK